jgi:hypothetical protein
MEHSTPCHGPPTPVGFGPLGALVFHAPARRMHRRFLTWLYWLFSCRVLMGAGTAPWAVASSEQSELGVMSAIQCQVYFDAEPGEGSLLLTGEGRDVRARYHASWDAVA